MEVRDAPGQLTAGSEALLGCRPHRRSGLLRAPGALARLPRGDQDKMERFYSYIPGMESRIGNHIAFPNYEVDELVEIGKVMCRELEYTMDADAVAALGEYMKKRIGMPFFANARTIRNAIDLARMRAAIRVFHEKTHPSSDGMVSEQDLMTITAADFPTPQELGDDSHAPG